MPFSNSNYFRQRVFTSLIRREVEKDAGLQDAARHVMEYDDPSALAWMVDRVSENVEAVADLSDEELKGAIEWYLRRGSNGNFNF